mmetsp:Transcript_20906/g.65347  ORF Transcript_20906/g.65347 Transcript_20906/m.65347 type:complete len:228 (-) Transcript_20906:87-770(-)
MGEAADGLPAHGAVDLSLHPTIHALAVVAVPAGQAQEAVHGQDLQRVHRRNRELGWQRGKLIQADRALPRRGLGQVVAEHERGLGRFPEDPPDLPARPPELCALLHNAVVHQEDDQARRQGEANDGNLRAHELLRQEVVGRPRRQAVQAQDQSAGQDGKQRGQEDVLGGDDRPASLPRAIPRHEEPRGHRDHDREQDSQEDPPGHHYAEEPRGHDGRAHCSGRGQHQ